MARCPVCHEKIALGASLCKNCGYDFGEGKGGRTKSLNPTVLAVVGGIIVIGAAIGIVAISGPLSRRVTAARQQKSSETLKSESLPPGIPAEERARIKSERKRQEKPQRTAEVEARKISSGQALAEEYRRKVDDLLEKAKRARKGLGDSKRMTPQASAILSQIETRLSSIRGSVGVLEGTSTEESRKLARVALDSMLSGVRRQFGDLMK